MTVKEAARVETFPGMGLEGDHAGGGNRQVTLLSEEAWQAACADLGTAALSPGVRRANLVVEGLDLRAAIGKGLQIGPCRIRVVAELRPCRLMDDAAPGLQDVLDPDCRGGVYGRVMLGGTLETGAVVEIVEIVEPSQVDLPLGGQR